MTAFKRLTLAAMVLLLVFLVGALRTAHGFPVDGYSQQTAEPGSFLIQDEGEAPILCYDSDAVVEKTALVDPDVKIYIYIATEDGSRALVIHFSNGSGVFMPMEDNGAVCRSLPMSPLRVLQVTKRVEAEGSGFVVVKRWPL